MKKLINTTFVIIGIILLNYGSAKAQYVIKEADEQFELFNYKKAVVLYTEAYQKKKTLKAAERLAEAYRLMRDFKQAESWYAIATKIEGCQPEVTKWYADMLRSNSKYNEAKIQYSAYALKAINLTPTQLGQLDLKIKSCDSAVKWMNKPKRIAISNEKLLNSPQSDWGAIKLNDQMVFTSDRTGQKINQSSNVKPFLDFDEGKRPETKTYGWTGNNYLRIYNKALKTDSVSLSALNTNTDYHTGAPSFSADGKEVFFTITRIPQKIERVKNSPSTINIEIYSSKNENNIWSKPIPFRYNNVQQWSVGDPFLSDDGNFLYFISDMPGGKGGTDIYVTKRSPVGHWEEAINLSAVNTPGNERTPMLSGEDLYFSTDGNISIGELDIFKAKVGKDGNLSAIENLGYPINSAQDDFSYYLTDKLEGFFASNRDGGQGSDDIYSFIKQQQQQFLLKGKVFNEETRQPLANAVVSLNKVDGVSLKINTDEKGAYQFQLNEHSTYEILASKTNFRNAVERLVTKDLTEAEAVEKNLYLIPIVEFKPIRLDNIYYDFDKAEIRKDAALELDKLTLIMKQNPTIWIELGSHTDSRGNDQYNKSLSQMRANAAVQYIIAKGIDSYRITAKGYGESVLVNQCVNGVPCTVDEHQLNRRTEFKIVKQ